MANYPVKMLKDESGTPFVPLVSTQAVRDPDGKTVQQILDAKLSPENLHGGQNVTVTTQDNDCYINVQFPPATTIIDNLDTQTSGQGALDAHQGYVLKGMIPDVVNNLTTVDGTKALSAYQGYLLDHKFLDYYTKTDIDAKVASANDLGMIKVGQGLSIDANGVLSATGGGGGGDSEPIGAMKLWPVATAPEGYLICDGSTLNKVDYPVLYDVLGSDYQIDADTFRLPDMRGRVAIGAGSFDGTNTFTLNATGGNYNVTLAEANLPSHSHSVSITTSEAGSHGHTASSNEVANHTHTGTTDGGGKHNHGGSTGGAGKHSHTTGTQEMRCNQAPSYSGLRPYGASSVGDVQNGNEVGNHTHTITEQANHTHTFTTGGGGKHSHTITVNSNGAHTHTVSGNTGTTGSGTAFSIVQPYLGINYIIKAVQTTAIQAVVEDTLNSSSTTNALSAHCGNILSQRSVPSGGTTGQVLKKKSATDNDLEWGDAADPNAISGDSSVKKIIALTYAEYEQLVADDEVEQDTEYHIIDAPDTISGLQHEIDDLQEQISTIQRNNKVTIITASGTKALTDTMSPVSIDASSSNNTNTNLVVTNNGIKIGPGVHHVLVSLSHRYDWDAPINHYFYECVLVNSSVDWSTQGATHRTEQIQYTGSVGPIFMNVSENDLLQIGASVESGSSTVNTSCTYKLTVQVID